MSSRLPAVVVALLLVLGLGGPALADAPLTVRITQVDASAFPNVRIIASVLGPDGKPIRGLVSTDLVVSEDGRGQRAGIEPATQTIPAAVVLVLDTSGSMEGKPIADAKAAMSGLIRSLGQTDEAAVITFNTAVTVSQPLTRDKTALIAATDHAAAGGNTAIFDAASAAMDVVAQAPADARKSIVLLTDGVDNSSKISLQAASTRLKAQGYPMYVIGLGNDLNRQVLQSLADASVGGQLLVAPTSAQLGGIYANLSEQIAVEYAVMYRSDTRHADVGQRVSVTVQVIRAATVAGSATAEFVVPPGHAVTSGGATTPAPAAPGSVAAEVTPDPYASAVVGLLGAATTLSLLLWAFALTSSQAMRRLEERRLGSLIAPSTASTGRERTQGRSLWIRAVLPGLRWVSRPFTRVAPASVTEGTRRKLVHAGEPFGFGPAEFLGLRFALGLVLAVVMLGVGLLVNDDPVALLLFALIGLLGGLLVPGIMLDRSVRARQAKILRALPTSLDMLALAASAGMTFDGAMSQVCQRWEGPLSDEFRRTLAEFRVGRDRRDALRGMAARTGVPEVVRFANAVVQADALGVPISKVLQDQAVEMRTRRRQRAEEAARKAPVKMLFPMVGLIFPALFVVILGPAVPRILEIFQAH